MNIWEVIAIVFSCVAMNHMGLIAAIENEIGHELPILNCVKCSSWWLTIAYGIYSTKTVIIPVAVAFLCSYAAVWLELLMGFIDSFYLRLYAKIVSTTGTDTASSDTDNGDTTDAVSRLSESNGNRHKTKKKIGSGLSVSN